MWAREATAVVLRDALPSFPDAGDLSSLLSLATRHWTLQEKKLRTLRSPLCLLNYLIFWMWVCVHSVKFDVTYVSKRAGAVLDTRTLVAGLLGSRPPEALCPAVGVIDHNWCFLINTLDCTGLYALTTVNRALWIRLICVPTTHTHECSLSSYVLLCSLFTHKQVPSNTLCLPVGVHYVVCWLRAMPGSDRKRAILQIHNLSTAHHLLAKTWVLECVCVCGFVQ